jgi:hypothetical protein
MLGSLAHGRQFTPSRTTAVTVTATGGAGSAAAIVLQTGYRLRI